MSSEAFNPNPTVFVPTKSKTTNSFSKGNSLWLDDQDDNNDSEEQEDNMDVKEDIDGDEIFGDYKAS